MNREQTFSLLRTVLKLTGMALAMYGIMTEVQWEPASGALLTLGGIAWDMWGHRQAAAVATVAKLDSTHVSSDGTKITILDPSLASAAREAATPARAPV